MFKDGSLNGRCKHQGAWLFTVELDPKSHPLLRALAITPSIVKHYLAFNDIA
jgi:hypothetical protein